MQIRLTVFDQDGKPYIIPAEVVESKFKRHQFAVHKSISLGDNLWTVSHVASGLAAATGGIKETAVAALTGRLKNMKQVELEAIIEKGTAVRLKLISVNL
ncbi:hypothetical protein [Massilia sp. TSP1-1-2]|uniref:hypothetical protein n=1 Tax=Massilia sp. TSP1-1-2 TaxID=2804649 RepID=UPI003CF6C315